jgi:hypothetical protein
MGRKVEKSKTGHNAGQDVKDVSVSNHGFNFQK